MRTRVSDNPISPVDFGRHHVRRPDAVHPWNLMTPEAEEAVPLRKWWTQDRSPKNGLVPGDAIDTETVYGWPQSPFGFYDAPELTSEMPVRLVINVSQIENPQDREQFLRLVRRHSTGADFGDDGEEILVTLPANKLTVLGWEMQSDPYWLDPLEDVVFLKEARKLSPQFVEDPDLFLETDLDIPYWKHPHGIFHPEDERLELMGPSGRRAIHVDASSLSEADFESLVDSLERISQGVEVEEGTHGYLIVWAPMPDAEFVYAAAENAGALPYETMAVVASNVWKDHVLYVPDREFVWWMNRKISGMWYSRDIYRLGSTLGDLYDEFKGNYEVESEFRYLEMWMKDVERERWRNPAIAGVLVKYKNGTFVFSVISDFEAMKNRSKVR